MRLSPQEVDHIALLSRLDLSAAERERAATELTQILNSFEKLNELDTQNIEPTAQVIPAFNVLREDTIRPSLSPTLALQNAPESEGDMFHVPRVVEAE